MGGPNESLSSNVEDTDIGIAQLKGVESVIPEEWAGCEVAERACVFVCVCSSLAFQPGLLCQVPTTPRGQEKPLAVEGTSKLGLV